MRKYWPVNGQYHSYPECTVVGKVTPFFFFFSLEKKTREENCQPEVRGRDKTKVWRLKKQVFLVKGDFCDPSGIFWDKLGSSGDALEIVSLLLLAFQRCEREVGRSEGGAVGELCSDGK